MESFAIKKNIGRIGAAFFDAHTGDDSDKRGQVKIKTKNNQEGHIG